MNETFPIDFLFHRNFCVICRESHFPEVLKNVFTPFEFEIYLFVDVRQRTYPIREFFIFGYFGVVLRLIPTQEYEERLQQYEERVHNM